MPSPKGNTVYGIASVSTVGGRPYVDHQGDIISTRELQKAAHRFMTESRAAGVQHMRAADGSVVPVGRVVSSLVLTNALQKALGIDVGCEPWIIGMQVENPAVLKAIRDGRLAGLSVAGSGTRTPVEIDL